MSKRDEIMEAAYKVFWGTDFEASRAGIRCAITETVKAAARIAAEEADRAAKAHDFRGLAMAEAIEERIRRELKGEG